MRALLLLIPSVLFLSALGCNEPFSNDDLLFLLSVPRKDTLEIDVPEAATAAGLRAAQQAGDGETPAKFYSDARATAEDTNEGVFSFLAIVEEISELEPTERDDDRRVWRFPASEEIEVMLVVERVRTATIAGYTSTSTKTEVDLLFNYALLFRPISPPDSEWLPPLFAGRFAPVESIEKGTGQLLLNFEVARLIDPSSQDRGLLFISYDTRFEETTVEVIADAEFDPDQLFQEPEAAVRYHKDADERGEICFAIRENFEGQPAADLLVVGAGWLPDQQGRADAVVYLDGNYLLPWWVAECWNSGFGRTYLWSNIPGFQGEGMELNCAPELREPVLRDCFR